MHFICAYMTRTDSLTLKWYRIVKMQSLIRFQMYSYWEITVQGHIVPAIFAPWSLRLTSCLYRYVVISTSYGKLHSSSSTFYWQLRVITDSWVTQTCSWGIRWTRPVFEPVPHRSKQEHPSHWSSRPNYVQRIRPHVLPSQLWGAYMLNTTVSCS